MGPAVNMHQMGVSFHCFSMEHIKIEEEVFLLCSITEFGGGGVLAFVRDESQFVKLIF